MVTTKKYSELEKFIHRAIGSSGLIEFTRFDLGEILRKERGGETPKSLRFVEGNPLVMKALLTAAAT